MDAPGPRPTTIADIVFGAEDARVILAVDPSLAGDADVADELTDVAIRAASAASFSEEVHQIADAQDWTLRIQHEGSAEILTLRES